MGGMATVILPLALKQLHPALQGFKTPALLGTAALLGSKHLPIPRCGHGGQGWLLCREGEEPLPLLSPGPSQQQHPLPEFPMVKLCLPS